MRRFASTLTVMALIALTAGTLTTPARAEDWTKSYTGQDFEACSMTTWNDALYIGMSNHSRVMRYDGAAWTQVNADRFGDEQNRDVLSLASFDGALYAGAGNTVTGAEVWSYDGTSWTQVNTDGFGCGPGVYDITALAVHDGRLYAVTAAAGGFHAYRYDGSGTSWTRVSPETAPWDPSNVLGACAISFDGRLWVGTENLETGAEVWKYDGAGWSQANPDGFGLGPNPDNSNRPHALAARSLEVYQDQLYCGTDGVAGDARVFRCDGGAAWTQVNADGFGKNNNGTMSMEVYNGRLYAGAREVYSAGAQVWAFDGSSWIQENTAGFGDNRNTDAASMCVFGSRLYVGTINNFNGAQVWTTAVLPATPFVQSFSPSYAKAGDSVTIYGHQFESSGTVRFGGAAAAAITCWSSDRIVATVPEGVPFGRITVTTANGTGTSTIGFIPHVSSWYFAEGCTFYGEFREYLCLGNPGNSAAHARAVYMFTDGTTSITDAYIPAGSRATVDVNSTAGRDRSLSALVVSDQRIVAERPMYFDYNGRWTGGHDTLGATAPSTTWYFAEGYTGPGFDEYICVLNPSDVEAGLTFRFQTQEARETVLAGYSVGPHARGTFKVNEVLGPDRQASLKLESSQPVVAERSMYFRYNGQWTGGHCVMGAPTLGREYYFAEGTTREGFHEYLTLQNPGTEDIEVDAVYQLGSANGSGMTRKYSVGAGRRSTIFVEDEVGSGQDVSVRLTSASCFMAERPMYFDYAGVWTGGHCVIGAAASGPEWFFAEGYTGASFDEWLCLQNPGLSDATVRITYLTQEAGAFPPREVAVPAGSRVTVNVNEDAGTGYQLSVKLEVAAGGDIVAERPVYFDYRGWTGGHVVVGYTP